MSDGGPEDEDVVEGASGSGGKNVEYGWVRVGDTYADGDCGCDQCCISSSVTGGIGVRWGERSSKTVRLRVSGVSHMPGDGARARFLLVRSDAGGESYSDVSSALGGGGE
jgi:hypothetical protein